MGCSRILLGDCDETLSKRRHNRINDTEVSWKAVTTVTFFRFFESSDKRHSYIERAGQIFRLRYTFTRKKGSEIWVHSEALLWEFSFVKDLVNCRYEEISIAVSVKAVRSDTLGMCKEYTDDPFAAKIRRSCWLSCLPGKGDPYESGSRAVRNLGRIFLPGFFFLPDRKNWNPL